MNKAGVFILILAVLLVSGASGCTKELTCNSPYIKVGAECCLDNNGNQICDKDEVQNNQQTPAAGESNYKLECLTNCNRGITITSQQANSTHFTVTLKNDNSRGCNMTCISTYLGALRIKVPAGESVESIFLVENAVNNRLQCADDWTRDKPICDLTISQNFEAK